MFRWSGLGTKVEWVGAFLLVGAIKWWSGYFYGAFHLKSNYHLKAQLWTIQFMVHILLKKHTYFIKLTSTFSGLMIILKVKHGLLWHESHQRAARRMRRFRLHDSIHMLACQDVIWKNEIIIHRKVRFSPWIIRVRAYGIPIFPTFSREPWLIDSA